MEKKRGWRDPWPRYFINLFVKLIRIGVQGSCATVARALKAVGVSIESRCRVQESFRRS